MKRLSAVVGVFKSDFVKVSAWSSVSTALKIITSFVSIKVVSSIIGPSGLAIVGQFLNTITLVSNIGTGGISVGVTKLVAENQHDHEKLKKIISVAGWVTLWSSLVVGIVVIAGATYFNQLVFAGSDHTGLIRLLGATVFLYSFNTLFLSILNGFKKFRKFILINILSNIFALAVTLLLVISFGLQGALLNCILSQVVIIGITFFFVYKEDWFSQLAAKPDYGSNELKSLLRFSMMALVSAILVPLVQIVIRSTIVEQLNSTTLAGYWEGMNRLSGIYLMFITTSISTYYLPRLSEIRQPAELKAEIVKTFKIVAPILFLISLSIFLFRDLIITIVYSADFSPMRELFGWQMVGDFFKISSWLIAYLFWAKGLVRLFIITEVAFSVSFIVFTKIGVSYYGVTGSVMAYALNYIIYFIVMLFIFKSLLLREDKKGITLR